MGQYQNGAMTLLIKGPNCIGYVCFEIYYDQLGKKWHNILIDISSFKLRYTKKASVELKCGVSTTFYCGHVLTSRHNDNYQKSFIAWTSFKVLQKKRRLYLQRCVRWITWIMTRTEAGDSVSIKAFLHWAAADLRPLTLIKVTLISVPQGDKHSQLTRPSMASNQGGGESTLLQ